jgi:hypothetical protein
MVLFFPIKANPQSVLNKLIYGVSILDGIYDAQSGRNRRSNSVTLRISAALGIIKDAKSGIL